MTYLQTIQRTALANVASTFNAGDDVHFDSFPGGVHIVEHTRFQEVTGSWRQIQDTDEIII